MTDGNLYERVVERGGFEAPKAKVRASSAVVPWRVRDGELEIYWMRRDPAMRFMGGWHAFPGGTVSRNDEALEEADWIVGRPEGLASDRVSGSMPEALTAGVDPLPPDAVPGIVAVAIYSFALGWNVFLYPLLFLQTPDNKVLTTGIFNFFQGTQIYWGQLMAAAAVLCIPPMILVLLLNRYIMEGFAIRS